MASACSRMRDTVLDGLAESGDVHAYVLWYWKLLGKLLTCFKR